VRGVYTGEEDEESYDADLEGIYEGCEGAGIHVWYLGLEMECIQCGWMDGGGACWRFSIRSIDVRAWIPPQCITKVFVVCRRP
jgi:hypothetical protein